MIVKTLYSINDIFSFVTILMYKCQKLFSCYNITIKSLLLYTKYIFNLVTLNSKTLRIFLASEILILVGMKT